MLPILGVLIILLSSFSNAVSKDCYGSDCKEDITRKSYSACAKYQEKVCPSRLVDSKGIMLDENRAAPRQFPYMALLGFGKVLSSANFSCAGSIVSKKYVLTAGHCTRNRTRLGGPLTWVRVGILRRNQRFDARRTHTIKTIHKHPHYRPPSKLNDIALLELNTLIIFDNVVQPACLYPGFDAVEDGIIVGWGITEKSRDLSNVLLYTTVHKFPEESCLSLPSSDFLGFNSSTQLCYGNKETLGDACQGDSGGPLETTNIRFPCLHTVIGVTSYGSSHECGSRGYPAIYTKVAAFLPWIESIVWPEKKSKAPNLIKLLQNFFQNLLHI